MIEIKRLGIKRTEKITLDEIFKNKISITFTGSSIILRPKIGRPKILVSRWILEQLYIDMTYDELMNLSVDSRKEILKTDYGVRFIEDSDTDLIFKEAKKRNIIFIEDELN